jgi:hypothetical protein
LEPEKCEIYSNFGHCDEACRVWKITKNGTRQTNRDSSTFPMALATRKCKPCLHCVVVSEILFSAQKRKFNQPDKFQASRLTFWNLENLIKFGNAYK